MKGPGKVTAQMQIEKHHTNRLEILHGGTISTMIDLGGYLFYLPHKLC